MSACILSFIERTDGIVVVSVFDAENKRSNIHTPANVDEAFREVNTALETIYTMRNDEDVPFEGFLEQTLPVWAHPLINTTNSPGLPPRPEDMSGRYWLDSSFTWRSGSPDLTSA